MGIKISKIVDFLESRNYQFKFKGSKDDSIDGFSTLFNYKANTLTFVSSLNKFQDVLPLFETKKIQLVITSQEEKIYSCFNNTIQIENPKSVFFRIIEHFFEAPQSFDCSPITSNISQIKKQSYISPNVTLGKNVKIGIGCVLDGDILIGENTVIHHNVVLRNKVTVGENCKILSGAVIGEDGFNPLKEEGNNRTMVKHYGGVTIEDNVQVGEHCGISRGTIDDTIIKKGVKLNKHAVIAHNVIIGKNTIFTTPTFVGGSVKIGENCHIAANVIKNQCIVGDNSVLGLGSVVIKNVASGITVVGNPAKPLIKKEV
ncbi:DapH/DapD/GlmU-related protein [Ornithinibacillus sp. 4-3]|uniref:DapH/DapD/GlmU-related protein n=1 Tax=Ornithinibacillus sp. 4-3 TaxID=3231488 RepID=A0AB39HQ80_9BACI